MDDMPGEERPLARMNSEWSFGVGRYGGHRSVGLDGETRGILPGEVVPEGRDQAVGMERGGPV